MKITGNATPELQIKAKQDINIFLNALNSKFFRRFKIWKCTDKQFKLKYHKKMLRNFLPEITSIKLTSINFKSNVMIEVSFNINGNATIINFIAQNKAYKTNPEKQFLFNPLSIQAQK